VAALPEGAAAAPPKLNAMASYCYVIPELKKEIMLLPHSPSRKIMYLFL